MSSGNLCQKHEEQIRVLLERVDDMESIKSFMHSLDKNAAVQTTMLEHIIEHNIKQDKRADMQDKRADRQSKRADKQDEIMNKMSNNLTELNKEIKYVKNEVDDVKAIQKDNESKHLVDLRNIKKKRATDALIQYMLPAGALGVILCQIIRMLKGGM